MILLFCWQFQKFSPVIVNRSDSQCTCTCTPDRTQYLNNVASSSAEGNKAFLYFKRVKDFETLCYQSDDSVQ